MLKFCVRLLPLCSRGRCLWFACNIAALGFGYPGPHRTSWAAFRFRRGWGGAAVSLGVFEGTREASGARVFSGGAFSAGHSASTVDRDSLGHPLWFVFGGIVPSGQGRSPHWRQDGLTMGVTPWWLRGHGFVRTQGPPGRLERGREWVAFSPELLQAPSLPGLLQPCPLGRGHQRGGPPGG